jgi:putative transposase
VVVLATVELESHLGDIIMSMEQTLTIVCKLDPTLEQIKKLDGTLKGFADACNYANSVVNPKITNKNRIQAEVYKAVREEFSLSANLAVRACARVASNRKVGKPVKTFKPKSVDYDARIFDYREKDGTVSLTTIEGRERIKLILGNYQIGKLKGRKPTSATLSKHRDGQYYIHIQIKDTPPTPEKTKEVIGVDLGRRDIAVTSNNDRWDGKQLSETRDRYSRTRRSIQRKGTKGAKRLLKRLSGREKRFQSWLNHNISRSIITQGRATKAIIAIEDLTGIRERTNQQPRSKTERRRSNSWAFYQLRQFLEYKGIKEGVKVIAVSPRYTSQTCSTCLHIGKRSNKNFKCINPNCKQHNLSVDADLNGAKMIRLVGMSVSHPETRNLLSCSLLDRITG